MSDTIDEPRACCARTTPESATTNIGDSCHLVDGVQEARITVRGGYGPKTVNVSRGTPVRLVFDRQESSRCSEELLIEAFGIRRTLPQNELTTIEFTPTAAGVFAFTCGMQMLRGEIVVS